MYNYAVLFIQLLLSVGTTLRIGLQGGEPRAAGLKSFRTGLGAAFLRTSLSA